MRKTKDGLANKLAAAAKDLMIARGQEIHKEERKADECSFFLSVIKSKSKRRRQRFLGRLFYGPSLPNIKAPPRQSSSRRIYRKTTAKEQD